MCMPRGQTIALSIIAEDAGAVRLTALQLRERWDDILDNIQQLFQKCLCLCFCFFYIVYIYMLKGGLFSFILWGGNFEELYCEWQLPTQVLLCNPPLLCCNSIQPLQSALYEKGWHRHGEIQFRTTLTYLKLFLQQYIYSIIVTLKSFQLSSKKKGHVGISHLLKP